MSKQIRRIVTGHDEAGRSIVLRDGPSPMVHEDARLPGFRSTDLWRTFESPVKIMAEQPEPTLGPRRQLPTENGSVFRINSFPPESNNIRAMTAEDRIGIFDSLGNAKGATVQQGSRHPLMHRTQTIDYAIVLSGEITMIIDDGEVKLNAGDVIIQCGTNHAWSNRSKDPCLIAFILIDGHFQPGLRQSDIESRKSSGTISKAS
jgi:mannose-6-phosphate isomerase-like protein (cupin superfamily)